MVNSKWDQPWQGYIEVIVLYQLRQHTTQYLLEPLAIRPNSQFEGPSGDVEEKRKIPKSNIE
jgi:hypothetical protein